MKLVEFCSNMQSFATRYCCRRSRCVLSLTNCNLVHLFYRHQLLHKMHQKHLSCNLYTFGNSLLLLKEQSTNHLKDFTGTHLKHRLISHRLGKLSFWFLYCAAYCFKKMKMQSHSLECN